MFQGKKIKNMPNNQLNFGAKNVSSSPDAKFISQQQTQLGIEFAFFATFFLMGTGLIAQSSKFKVQSSKSFLDVGHIWIEQASDDCLVPVSYLELWLEGSNYILRCTWKDDTKHLQGYYFTARWKFVCSYPTFRVRFQLI